MLFGIVWLGICGCSHQSRPVGSGSVKAEEPRSEAVRLDPNNAETCCLLGKVYADEEQYDKAVVFYRKAVALKPGYAEAWDGLAFAYGLSGRYDEAVEPLREAIRLEPGMATARRIRLGETLISLRRYGEARTEFIWATQSEPNNAEGWAGLGCAYAGAGVYDGARNALTIALRIQPDVPHAHWGLGQTYVGLKQYDKAIGEFEAAMKTGSSAWACYGQMGFCYEKMDKHKESIKAYEEALRLNPDSAGNRLSLGMVYLRDGQKDKATEQYTLLKGLDEVRAAALLKIIQAAP
jgi:tetratricopeptide (TPR) repeat protein